MTQISIQVLGVKELSDKFAGLPPVLKSRLARAGKRYAPELLDVQGVRKYPPQTAANLPPAPYYVRGKGTQYASGRNDGKSEQYNTRWTVESSGSRTTIANSASYSPYLADTFRQARAMARIGWVKLIDAARKTQERMREIYVEEINEALKQMRLK